MRQFTFSVLTAAAIAVVAGCSGDDDGADTSVASTIDFATSTTESGLPTVSTVDVATSAGGTGTGVTDTTGAATAPLTYQVVGAIPVTGGGNDLTVLVEGERITDLGMLDVAAEVLEEEGDVTSAVFIDDPIVAPLVGRDDLSTDEQTTLDAHQVAELTGTTLTFMGPLASFGTVEVGS